MKRGKNHKQFLRQFHKDPLNAALWIDLVRHFPQTMNLACTWLRYQGSISADYYLENWNRLL